ncbi:EamA family transporter [Chimaeribacter coloradensis]|uniref:EamA family transporter n=1 Tax=Chimaeribacter coloradensis TaxID=2060068 RepID=A0A2N5E8M7_9GAMM|nr:DMT family transporter [Chimaeribacter coloradensis]PLR38260.1 EamA family transporter [Chimaeribacter coloradensis]
MMAGVLFALAAGLMWGLIFVGPLVVPEYPAMLQSAGRYVAFGLIALPLAWFDRRRLRQLTRGDWVEACKLSAVGNLLYYVCLAGAIQRTGAPISTMIIGTLPVVIAVSANLFYGRHEGRLAWHRLLPSLLLIGAGLCLVNIAELRSGGGPTDIGRYLSGIGLALVALVCWTWYPLRNARWMRSHPQHRAGTWATAQGLAVLPMALVAYALACGQMALTNGPFPLPFGPRPGLFIALMAAIGLFCSWLGTLCWSEASQRLPTVLVGPLIVFEILAGLAYTFLLRQSWPPVLTLCGIACLMIGVISAMRIKPEPLPA